MDVDTAVALVKALTPDEQLEVVDLILADLPTIEDDDELSDEMKAELDRRIAAYKADPSKALPFEVVCDRIQAKYAK